MSHLLIYCFIAIMWLLILAGGGIVVALVAQITVQGYGEEMDFVIASAIKAAIALVLVVFWIVILTKFKDRIFQKQIRF